MIAAAVAALLVIPAGTAGAQPAQAVNLGPVRIALVNQAVEVSMTSGTVKQVGNELQFANSKGVVKNRVPLSVKAVDGKTYPVKAEVAANGKSAQLKPHQVALPKRPLTKPKNKGQAYDNMMKLWGQNAGCVGPPALVGGIIGFFVGLIIFGWITVGIGAAIGAYVGLQNCGRGRWGDKYRGETIRAFWTWWNWAPAGP